ncbi:type-F conjugative transfer system pilin assembly protein TrbC (plasmid) [Arsenophonus nasoniae]|uniref:Type-F conjugative transfer system pilin assembly protein TrbC n=1 Tax=Arsenophonus nasoniae TaxID=638 RepID=A0AA95GVF0_9GAMM|nr:type-F conjugative transfer system pilin assembly protein TrbC [Arsenophonus nasoniae]
MKKRKRVLIAILILTASIPALSEPKPDETIAESQAQGQAKRQAYRAWLDRQADLQAQLKAAAKRPDFLRDRPLSSNSQQFIDQLKNAQQALAGEKPKTGARYLVSFSIPQTALINMLQEAKRFAIPATIRGLVDNNMPATVQAVKSLVEAGQVDGVQIDPQPFTNYHIDAVPALVVQCEAGVDVVRGNLHLEAALSRIVNAGDCATTASALLQQGGIRG